MPNSIFNETYSAIFGLAVGKTPEDLIEALNQFPIVGVDKERLGGWQNDFAPYGCKIVRSEYGDRPLVKIHSLLDRKVTVLFGVVTEFKWNKKILKLPALGGEFEDETDFADWLGGDVCGYPLEENIAKLKELGFTLMGDVEYLDVSGEVF